MVSTLTYLASTEAASGDIFSALGIDWKTLILQIVAFLILVWCRYYWRGILAFATA